MYCNNSSGHCAPVALAHRLAPNGAVDAWEAAKEQPPAPRGHTAERAVVLAAKEQREPSRAAQESTEHRADPCAPRAHRVTVLALLTRLNVSCCCTLTDAAVVAVASPREGLVHILS